MEEKDNQQDTTTDVEILKQKAIEGDRTAQYAIGLCYHEGEGVIQNYEEAIRWYKKAADQGYAAAQVNLGICYRHGHGKNEDIGQALTLFFDAAKKGHKDAENEIKALTQHAVPNILL